ncbi:hypothetical protein BU202_06390 [Streptococcus cuniculi]|uniref:Uncharacterized protein n=1 Tax=Streptococcus cuniculi TaxID=1432788 RepID=A0A1Q8E7A0_9STRE|nr:hypothetical protein [Streptococcus cuniculi]OLF47656.1 hypothetical protein BU202_06390 [Streptococcus cuniculi]
MYHPFKKIRQEYRETRGRSNEDFLEWFLKRHLSDKGKIILIVLCWLAWTQMWIYPALFVYLFEGVVVLCLLYGIAFLVTHRNHRK